jgi:hypothetical protein
MVGFLHSLTNTFLTIYTRTLLRYYTAHNEFHTTQISVPQSTVAPSVKFYKKKNELEIQNRVERLSTTEIKKD